MVHVEGVDLNTMIEKELSNLNYRREVFDQKIHQVWITVVEHAEAAWRNGGV